MNIQELSCEETRRHPVLISIVQSISCPFPWYLLILCTSLAEQCKAPASAGKPRQLHVSLVTLARWTWSGPIAPVCQSWELLVESIGHRCCYHKQRIAVSYQEKILAKVVMWSFCTAASVYHNDVTRRRKLLPSRHNSLWCTHFLKGVNLNTWNRMLSCMAAADHNEKKQIVYFND